MAEAVTDDPSLTENVNTLPVVSNGSLCQIRQTKRSKTVTMAITMLDPVSDELLKDEVALTESQLADLMVASFSTLFPSDNFSLGHEPLPGTKCRFCEEDLLSCNKTRAVHSYWCAKESLLKEITGAVDLECKVPEICSWVGKGLKTQGKVCGAIIANPLPPIFKTIPKSVRSVDLGHASKPTRQFCSREVQNLSRIFQKSTKLSARMRLDIAERMYSYGGAQAVWRESIAFRRT